MMSANSQEQIVMSAEEIEQQKLNVVRKHGDWTAHNIHLGHGVYTIGPHDHCRKLERLVQTAADLVDAPFSELRVLDLACLEGGFAIEFARQGAEVLGIEGREQNLAKARFAKEVLQLDRLSFELGDVRDLCVEKHGCFDIVICCGILYHLDAPDVFEFVHRIASVCTRLTIIDTSFSLRSAHHFEFDGQRYAGNLFPEHEDAASEQAKLANLWGSLDNTSSVWLTRPSLLNLLQHSGFTSAFEVLNPSLVGQLDDRIILAALKGKRQFIHAMPELNGEPVEDWPEQPSKKCDAMQYQSYRLKKRLTLMVPKPARRAAKAVLRKLGLRRKSAPWDWDEPWVKR